MEAFAYHQLWLHRLMLRDRVRNEVYRKAIFKTVKQGYTVLDMGAGTGILSIFAVQAGAKKVYAVERTNIAKFARQLVAKNAMEGYIEIIQGDMETIKLPEQVDVIVSEWMGGYGVDENLLAPLLVARDRWLKPDGKILPERVTAWMAPAWDSDHNSDMRFWRSQPYGVNLNPIADYTAQEVLWSRHHISKRTLFAEPQQMWTTDVYNCSVEEVRLPFRTSLSFLVKRDGLLNALATWFWADFGHRIKLTNAPNTPQTHWGRFVFPLERPTKVKPKMKIVVEFSCEPAESGYCHNKWSVRVGNGEWELHNTRKAIY